MNIIKTYLLNSSLHGIPYIADSRYHWTERIFWIIMVCLAWWASVYIMISSYDQFENSAISFTVDTLYLDWVSEFPAIVFCEKGNYKYVNYGNEWFNGSEDYRIGEIFKDIVFFKGTMAGIADECSRELVCPFIKSNFTKYAEVIRSTCEDLFLFCAWNDVEFPCCEQIMPMQTIFGQCYALNSNASLETPTKPMYMNVSHEIGMDVGKVTIEVSNPDVKIFTLSHDSVPSYTDDSNVAMDGTTTSTHQSEQNNIYLGIQEIVNDNNVRSTSIKRRGCRFKDENNLKSSKIYSYSSCIVDCILDIQLKECNCNHHLMPSIDENSIICDIEGLMCLTRALDTITEKAATECVCESSCSDAEINVIGSIAIHNFLGFKNSKSVTQLNFILRPPTVRSVRNVVYGYLDLIVSMGGTAGLCIGASILTIVEIFYYFFVRPMDDYIIKRSLKKKTLRIKHRKNKVAVFPFVH